MRLLNKTALVTGAGRGIGKGCALELARDGADVIINDRPDSPDLEHAVEAVRGLGRSAHGIEADVFSRKGCEQLLNATLERTDRIDVLVSNPAYSSRASFLEYDAEEFENVVRRTLVSGFHMSQLVARQMVRQGDGGKIIFISSVQAEMPLAHSVAYGAAKAGLNHMTQTIAVELSSHRINVNAIEPGWTNTPGEHETFSEKTIEREGGRLPWGRLGTVAEVGRTAAFLASGDADYITGTVIPVDGGFRFKDCRAAEPPQT